MIDESAKINKSIENYIHTCWILSDISSIQSEYGEQVLNQVREIYHYSMNLSVDWNHDSVDEISQRFTHSLQDRYSFLSENATKTLLNCFMYQWK